MRTGALALLLLAPAAAFAQGVTIDHKEIGCIVAGKYPKINACIAPASMVKTARVYFRPETLSAWYYVKASSDSPCHSGVLLKPSKALIGKKIFYYVDVQGEGTARTPEYAPTVVASAEECKTNLPVAPLSATGPAAVFPSLPTTGFVTGGASTAAVVGGVAIAAAVGGGLKVLNDDGNTTPSTPPPVPATSPTTTAPPATVPPTTVTPPGPSALVVACQAAPRSGDAPLRVSFATFPSGGTGTYDFEWTFGDGAGSTNPNPAHTFLSAGVFNSTVVVRSGAQTASCSRPITVTTPPPPPTTTTTLPPKTRTLTVDAGKNSDAPGSVTSDDKPPAITCTWGSRVPCLDTGTYADGTKVTLTVTSAAFVYWGGACTAPSGNTCTIVMDADKTVRIETTFSSLPPPSPGVASAGVSVILTTVLEVPDGEGQVVMNGRSASAVRPGLAAMAAEGRIGANRVEAVLVRGPGRSGIWRFELSGQPALKPGSLRVVAGTVALITGDAVVFRLQGKPGERIVFTFEID